MKVIHRRNASALICLLLIGASNSVALQTERAFTTATRYDLRGQITGTIAPDPDGTRALGYPAARNTYNSRGLIAKREAGELSAWLDESVLPKDWGSVAVFAVHLTTEFVYDDFGRKVLERVRGANGNAEALIQYSYTDKSLVRCKAVRMNPAAFATPPTDACVPGVEGVFGPDRITRYSYDLLDQIWKEERAVGVPGLQQTYVTNAYNHRQLTAQTDANGNRTELRYDGYGRLKRRVYPSPTVRGAVNESDYHEFTYDPAGNLLVDRKRDGRTVTTDFDANHRPIRKDLSDNTYSADVYYSYDLRGLELYSRFGGDGGLGETLSYDGFGKLRTRNTTLTGASQPIHYRYDANGNRTRVSHPDGHTFGYSFDGLDRVDGVSSTDAPGDPPGTSRVLGVEYASDGGRATLLRPGAFTTYIRDNAQRLARFRQAFTSAGNAFENEFSYNPASQITQFVQGNDQYNFREMANRTGVYLANGLNQYTAVGGQAIAYDANGNLRNDGELSYTYDMENRLVAAGGRVAGMDVDARLKWDTNGRLHQLVVNGVATQFLYDGDALIAEYSGAAMTRRYVHGDQADEPWLQYNDASIAAAGRRYLVADHHGSVVAHSDNGGRVLNTLAYDSYGIPAAANVDRFGYTGQAWIKQLGLYHYKARMYHPKLGRFLQTDPIAYRDDMNLYAYVGGDPVNGIDPSGKSAYTKLGKAIRAIVKGEDFAETFKDNIEDFAILVSPSSSIFDKTLAGAGLLSELLPVSKSDIKDVGRALDLVDGGNDAKKRISALKPGPFAGESIPGHRGRVNASEQARVNEINAQSGCHTCGATKPGTKSGNAVGDHQPPQALDEPLRIYPHCINCSRRQGGEVLQEMLKRRKKQ